MTQPPMEPPRPRRPAPSRSAAAVGARLRFRAVPASPALGLLAPPIARMALRIGIPVAAFIVIGVVSAIIANRDDADRDDDGNVTEQGDLDVFAVAKGDCLDDETLSAIGTTQSSEISEVTAIPCSEPHGYEAFHLFDLEGDDFPGPTRWRGSRRRVAPTRSSRSSDFPTTVVAHVLLPLPAGPDLDRGRRPVGRVPGRRVRRLPLDRVAQGRKP